MIDLLPRGYFTLTVDEKKIEGRFCTWSLKRFCDKQEILSIMGMVERLTTGLGISDVAAFILSGVEYSYVKNNKAGDFKFSEFDACEWIDEMGGIQSAELTKLISHALETNEKEEQKKTTRRTSVGQNSKVTAVVQD
jgi:hypothetical protein